MIVREGKWGELFKGAYIRDKAGKTWKVFAEREGWWGIVDREGTKAKLSPRNSNSPVTFLEPTEEEAMKAVRERLDGTPIAYKEEESAGGTGMWHVFPFPTTRSGRGRLEEARAHIFMMHGTYVGDVKTIKDLMACHDELHSDPDLKYYVPHIHGG